MVTLLCSTSNVLKLANWETIQLSTICHVQGRNQTSKNEEAPSDRAPQARVENGGAEGCGGEGYASPENFFIFILKIAIFGAYWAPIFTVQRTVLYADHAD